jgi:hypothetical protein
LDDNTPQFVFNLNVSRFVEKIRLEHDSGMRAAVKRLLVKEEDKFCRKRERIAQLQRHFEFDEGK